MKKEMLINVLQPEECRIAIVEDGVLEELYVERTSNENYTGNIYKGRVVNLEPAIQAAFVDFSVGRNGFLHVSDVEPQYYQRLLPDDAEPPARDRSRDPRASRTDSSSSGPARGSRADEPRMPRVADSGERFELPPPLPPQLEDLSSTRPPLPEPEPPREWGSEGWDLGWDDRPDRSEKPRPGARRRFGEGLNNDWDEPEPPQPVLPPGFDLTFPAPDSEPTAPPLPPRFGTRAPDPVPHPPVSEARREPIVSRTQPEPAEPADFGTDLLPIDDIEAELPPSRTGQRRRTRDGDSPQAREPRRGRGRGRVNPPGPESPRPVVPSPADSGYHDEIVFESGIEELEDLPRRRAGRDNIRARGGERGTTRPRPSEGSRPAARPAGSDELLDRDSASYRPAASPGPRPAPSGERGRQHDRAGERGYVPRRERTQPGGESTPTHLSHWDELAADLGAAPSPSYRLEDDVVESPSDESAEPLDRRPRRRRRRRTVERGPETRRRSRLERLEGDEPRAPRARPPFSEESEPARFSDDQDEPHDFDLDEDREVFSSEAFAASGTASAVDDEIDPELEEEIRREIEEIQALEREMGLRATTEARPRRGDDIEALARGERPRPRGLFKPPIQDVFRRGDEVLVQVIKESIGTKGPTLSTYISIPGRYLVLMPGLNRVGVSRKIADESQRRRLREIMHALDPPKGLGFIVRTAGLDRTKRELARDLAYLLRLWKVILRRIKKAKAPSPIYQESDMIIRTIRDIFTSEIDTIWIDERNAFERAQEFMRVVMPKMVDRIKFYDEKAPLFHKYGIEDEIAKIQRRRVDLPGGGSIVIDQTEALVAIDVNSGNFRVEDDAERTAYEMNLRAAKEIARQLRLRDLGGVIVNDFIDMREEKHRRGVERALREAVRRDRARTKILRMSQFGLVEMTRQRIRPSLKRSVYEDCPHCAGAGVIKTVESMAIDVMRLLAVVANRTDIRRVQIAVAGNVASYLNNRKRGEIAAIEAESHLSVHVRYQHDVPAEHLQVECFDASNNEVRLFPVPVAHPHGPRRGR